MGRHNETNVIDASVRFRARNRIRKVLRLVEALDRYYRNGGGRSPDAFLVERLGQWHDSDWATLASFAGVNYPSEETREMVIGVFQDRATRDTVIDVEREESDISNAIARRRGWEIG